MSPRRRGLMLVGLALVLGGLAASDVARRESALAARIGAPLHVVVAGADLPAGEPVDARRLAVRRVPARYAPVGAAVTPAEVAGRRLASAVPRGGYVTLDHVQDDLGSGPPVRRGERALEIVASGPPDFVVAGARVDVLVTRERAAELMLQDVEVLAAVAAPEAPEAAGVPRVAATLRLTLRQAVALAAASEFARDVRLLPRSPDDRRRVGTVRVGEEGA